MHIFAQHMSSHQQIGDFLSVLWITSEQQDVFLAVCELGAQPASVIARKVWLERTKAYRFLGELATQWLIETSQSEWVKTFFVSDLSGLKEKIQERERQIAFLHEEQNHVFSALTDLSKSDLALPEVRIFEWESISNLFRDILSSIESKGLKSIRMFASNSYDEQSRSSGLSRSVTDFFDTLKSKKILVESFIGTGTLIMERIEKIAGYDALESLPQTDSSTHVLVVGSVVYVIIYKDKPIGIRLDSKHFAHVLHLLLDNLNTQA